MNSGYRRKFSVLGDSLSTFEYVSEPFDASFYANGMKYESGVMTVADTWWGQVIEFFDGELLVNNSISGSTVFKHPDYEVQSYGSSDERTASLGREGACPDVIMVFMGTNDWGYGILPTTENDGQRCDTVFSVAYNKMLCKLKSNYPEAEIWCITPFVGVCERKTDFHFPYLFGGRHLNEYCEVIRKSAERFGCVLIDLYHCPNAIDTVDGFHANKAGMGVISSFVIKSIERANR